MSLASARAPTSTPLMSLHGIRAARCAAREVFPPCQRAEEKCKSLGHCVSVEVNRERTIGTLKSLQVYMPTPPPVCDGYAFHDNGSAPIAVAAPLDVTFDDLGGGDAPPNEGWCYRDTSVSQPPALPGARNGVNHNGLSGNPHCRMETCFDLDRCRPRRGDPPNAPLRLYIDTPTPKTYDMRRWPSCLRQTLRTAIVERAELACLVVPTVNLNCEWDVCDPATHPARRDAKLEQDGHNHVIWDYIDGPKVKYPTDEALFMKTSMRLSDYRPGFDVPFPLLPNGEASHVTPAELEAARGRRTVLASFKGVCQAKTQRPALQRMHDGRELIMLCTDRGGPGKNHYDYKTLMLTSVFSVAPAGNGLHSFRLAEAIFFGSIPVIVDDEIVLPFLQRARLAPLLRAHQDRRRVEAAPDPQGHPATADRSDAGEARRGQAQVLSLPLQHCARADAAARA